MTDEEFLNWLADRLVNVYGESENVDFVQRLRSTADVLSVVQEPQDSGTGDPADCGHPNPVWYVDSRLWNEVLGGDSEVEVPGVLCPSCFADKADEHFAKDGRWQIAAWHMLPDLWRITAP